MLECQAVFVEKERALGHALKAHIGKFYEKQETQAEPPKGNFVCVARCGLSGELLGPPNYHGYSEKLSELHRTRFAHLTLDEYRSRITNEADRPDRALETGGLETDRVEIGRRGEGLFSAWPTSRAISASGTRPAS